MLVDMLLLYDILEQQRNDYERTNFFNRLKSIEAFKKFYTLTELAKELDHFSLLDDIFRACPVLFDNLRLRGRINIIMENWITLCTNHIKSKHANNAEGILNNTVLIEPRNNFQHYNVFMSAQQNGNAVFLIRAAGHMVSDMIGSYCVSVPNPQLTKKDIMNECCDLLEKAFYL